MRKFLSSIKDHLIRRPLPDDTRWQLAAMADDLRRGGPLYLPSRFWTNLNSVNEAQLAAEGFSLSALHEMRADQIANYLSRMDSLTKKAIYLKNWRNWHNTEDDVRIDESTFRLPGRWRVALERVDPVQDMFAEKVFLRAA